ncbi:hypothetical protein GCM10007391_03290 [Alteromonas halophila]|uniref:Uncharacterized protein n=1 Tax=Alteromonas halophila TaxID=516698 RepID=A0A918JDX0_9ALTE|nr:hypothetical protein GCM10007391_03290 [Alteromonas halophila]
MTQPGDRKSGGQGWRSIASGELAKAGTVVAGNVRNTGVAVLLAGNRVRFFAGIQVFIFAVTGSGYRAGCWRDNLNIVRLR